MNGIDQLKRDEGFSATVYTDTTGNPTIGYGTNLADGLTTDEAAAILEIRANKATATLLANLPWYGALDPTRQAVLTNMCYNLGWGKLAGFHNMLAAFEARDWETAAAEMLDSLWARQVGERATRLAEQTRTGEWT